MTSSLEKLVEDIIKESKAKAEKVRKDGQTQVEEAIAAGRTEAVRDADKLIQEAKAEAEAERNRIVSQERQKARIAYLTEKNRVLQEVLKDVRARLLEATGNESSYRPFLLKAITRGVDAVPSESVKVALCDRDLKRYKGRQLLDQALAATQTRKKAILSDEPLETIGGAVVTSEDGKMRADCTLEARLQLMEPQILAEITKILFAS